MTEAADAEGGRLGEEKRRTMNKLNIALLAVAIVFSGCTTHHQISAHYVSDKDYRVACLSGFVDPEKAVNAKPRSRLNIDFPECIETHYAVHYRGDEIANVKESSTTNSLRRVNDQLYLSITQRGGQDIITPMYFDEENECIYTGGFKYIKDR